MPDPLTYNQLLEKSKEVDELLNFSSMSDEEKQDLEYMWNCLKSREQSKFDAIINVIKDCDKQISSREKDIIELKKNQDFWKNKRKNVINIVKKAYEHGLINCLPTGNKYEATIRRVKSKLIDNFESWNTEERKNFGLLKITMTKKISDGTTINWDEETIPNKKAVRDSLEANDGKAPKKAYLLRKFSLTYNLRKRLRISI
tara:strand:- start:1108 stop:1710 length:603 start_codon:yes stop_codon:yes gene_type:complete